MTTLQTTYAALAERLNLRGHRMTAPQDVGSGYLRGECRACGRTVHVDEQGATGDAVQWDCEAPLWEGEV